MLYNFLLLSIRNLKKYKLNSIISIFCLSLGLTGFLTSIGYQQFEKKYDDFHINSDQIYQVSYIKKTESGRKYNRILTGAPLAEKLKNIYPEISEATKISKLWDHQLQYNDDLIKADNLYYADNSFFKVFSFNLIKGNIETALKEPAQIIISKKIAENLFGNKNPIGETIKFYDFTFDKELNLTISGVLDRIPENSSLNFDVLISYNSLKTIWGDSFFNKWESLTWTYIKSNKITNHNELESKINYFPEKYIPDSKNKLTGISLIPIKNTYFAETDGYSNSIKGNKEFTRLLLIFGIIILIASCINYITLTVARSNERIKEIGIRKTIGANNSSILYQLFIENLLITSISAILSIILLEAIAPYFSNLVLSYYNLTGNAVNKIISLNNFSSLNYWLIVLTTIFSISFIVIIYPFLSLFRTQTIRYSANNSKRKSKSYFQIVLVSLQFVVISLILVLSFHINKQFDYLIETNFDYSKDNKIFIPLSSQISEKQTKLIKTELLRNDIIKNITLSSALPGHQQTFYMSYTKENSEFGSDTYFVDSDFLKTFDIELLEGENFDPSNSSMVIINKTAAEKFNLNINEELNILNNQNKILESYTIAGIVPDFYHRGYTNFKRPLIICMAPDKTEYMILEYTNCSPQQIYNLLASSWKKYFNGRLCPYQYLKDSIKSEHRGLAVIKSFMNLLTYIIFTISILGLFALSYFLIEKKVKEIGIRKVIGATKKDILKTLTYPIIIIITVSFIITIPISYFLLIEILSEYPYQYGISFYLYCLSFILILFISTLTISYKTILAANTNPVNTLKYE